ncbi:MAG: flagellar hook-basal body complex protein FliE [Spirochaetia bacterium]
MIYLNTSQVSGHVFEMARTDPRHLAGQSFGPAPASTSQSFGNLLLESLNSVNAMQQTSEALSIQAVVDPESVNAHDVTIAAAKASMSLSITKNVVDRVIQAYREIQSVR